MTLKPRYQLLLLAFVVLGLYYSNLFGTINTVDDQKMLHFLLNSPDVKWTSLFFHGSSNNYYRPLLMATFFADLHLWLLDTSFMHLENVLLHLANSLFVFFLAREAMRILDPKKAAGWLPFCASLIFAIHPINTEAVDWISGRTDVLAGTFLLPAAWLLLRGLRTDRPGWSWLGGVFFLLGCLSKETAVFFFPAGILWCLAVSREKGRGVP